MPTHASTRDLRRGFDRLRHFAGDSESEIGHLLRFYAVECGLKHVLLRRQGHRSTAQLCARLLTHDLVTLARELNLSPTEYATITECRRANPRRDEQPVGHQAVHKAWRYGVALDPDHQSTFAAGLNRLIRWCEEEMR